MTQFGSHIKIDKSPDNHIKLCLGKTTIITPDTEIRIWFDSSGSMDSTLAPLEDMRSNNLKDTLLPFYNNDETLYDEKVTVQQFSDEDTFEHIRKEPTVLEDGIIHLLFQDEASSGQHMSYVDSLITKFENGTFTTSNYQAVIYQVEGGTQADSFKSWLQGLEADELSGYLDRMSFHYDITDGGTPEYYADLIEGEVL